MKQQLLKRLEEELPKAKGAIEIPIKGVSLEVHEDCYRFWVFIADYFHLPEGLSHRAWKRLILRLQQISRVPFLKSDIKDSTDTRQGIYEEKHYLLMDIPKDATPEEIVSALEYLYKQMEKHNIQQLYIEEEG